MLAISDMIDGCCFWKAVVFDNRFNALIAIYARSAATVKRGDVNGFGM